MAPTDAPTAALRIEMVWGDICQVDADLVAVGSYKGMPPTGSALALDKAISGPDRPLLLTGHSQRGLLRGDHGDIDLFPWRRPDGPSRLAAIAGMGYPATFGEPELRRLANNLVWVAAGIPEVTSMATVLIGSGAGNMEPADAIDAFVRGLADAISERQPERLQLATVQIVEWQFDRAVGALERLQIACAEPVEGVAFEASTELVRSGSGGTSDAFDLALALASVARTLARDGAPPGLDAILADIPERDGLRASARQSLCAFAASAEHARDALDLARTVAIDLSAQRSRRREAATTRLSFVTEGGKLTASAITDTATVPERLIGVDLALVREAAARMTKPAVADLAPMASFMAQLVVPRDFRSLLRGAPRVVFEVDRPMALVHWEMLSADVGGRWTTHPIGLSVQVARQLRTVYSPPPRREGGPGSTLRALVVGDPGDPAADMALAGARQEAMTVANLFRELGLDVVELIGPPGHSPTAQPASRLEVLQRLTAERFDVLHYAGHAAFDNDDPSERAGWVFADGLLTSQELAIVDNPPRLVVANACHSGRVSEAADDLGTEVGLLPSLADEFFRRGVRDYVGTAWAIDDDEAIDFATTLYGELLVTPEPGAPGATLGAAMLQARRRLSQRRSEHASWAAYQHYGDLNMRLTDG